MITLFYLLACGSWQYLACDKLYCLYFCSHIRWNHETWKGFPKFPTWSLNEAELPSWWFSTVSVWTAYLSLPSGCPQCANATAPLFPLTQASQLFHMSLFTFSVHGSIYAVLMIAPLWIFWLWTMVATPAVSALSWDLIYCNRHFVSIHLNETSHIFPATHHF